MVIYIYIYIYIYIFLYELDSILNPCIFLTAPYNEPVAIQGCPDNIVVNIDDNASNAPSISWTEPGLNSWSSCPTMVFLGPETNGGDFPLGITELSYRASDAAGNTDDCQFSVTVRRSSGQLLFPYYYYYHIHYYYHYYNYFFHFCYY